MIATSRYNAGLVDFGTNKETGELELIVEDGRAAGEHRDGDGFAHALELRREVGREVLDERDAALCLHDRLVRGENESGAGPDNLRLILAILKTYIHRRRKTS